MGNDEKPAVVTLQIIYDTMTGQVKVHGPMHLKTMCVIALSQAIQIVATHKPPIIQPASQNGKHLPH